MDRVDAMKNLQGWTDVSVLHFRDLGVFGEQLLLSIRYGAWTTVYEPGNAANWAPVLALGDPGVHPRLPRRDRRRSHDRGRR